MDDNPHTAWYLVRTKTGKERWVRDQLANAVPEVFLPMLKARIRAPSAGGARNVLASPIVRLRRLMSRSERP